LITINTFFNWVNKLPNDKNQISPLESFRQIITKIKIKTNFEIR